MLQDLILHLKIPIGTPKKCLEIYIQFGDAPSKRFASTVLYETELPQHSYGQTNSTQDIQFNIPKGRKTQFIFKLCL